MSVGADLQVCPGPTANRRGEVSRPAIWSSGRTFSAAPRSDCLAGHTKDNAAGLVLGYGSRAGLTHGQQSSGPVTAHARQDHSHDIATQLLSTGIEQHVHRGPMPVHRLALVDQDGVAGAAAAHLHLMVARRHQHMAGQNGVAVVRLLHADLAQSIQPLGIRQRKTLRHVQHDHRPGSVGGKGRQNVTKGFRTSRRGADGQDLESAAKEGFTPHYPPPGIAGEGGRGRRYFLAPAAVLTLAMISSASSTVPVWTSIFGLGHEVHSAQFQGPNVVSHPFSVKDETMTTGMG